MWSKGCSSLQYVVIIYIRQWYVEICYNNTQDGPVAKCSILIGSFKIKGLKKNLTYRNIWRNDRYWLKLYIESRAHTQTKSFPQSAPRIHYYCQIYIRRTLVGNKIVDHSDVVGASPIGAAPNTSSFSAKHLASI